MGLRHSTAGSLSKTQPSDLRGPDHLPNFQKQPKKFPAHGGMPEFGIHESEARRIGELGHESTVI